MRLLIGSLAATLALALAAGWWFWQSPANDDAATLAMDSPELLASIASGQVLYAQSCAACHGANLEGQPNWQSPGPDGLPLAPPHDESGHTFHHGDGLLFDYIALGGQETLSRMGVEFESGMPAFGDQLSEAQIWDILTFIKSTWPENIRAAQVAQTAAEQVAQTEAEQAENGD